MSTLTFAEPKISVKIDKPEILTNSLTAEWYVENDGDYDWPQGI